MYREKIKTLIDKARTTKGGEGLKRSKTKKSQSQVVPLIICIMAVFMAKEHFSSVTAETNSVRVLGKQNDSAPISDLVTTLELPIFKADFSQSAGGAETPITDAIFAKKEIKKKQPQELPEPIKQQPRPIISQEPSVNYEKLVSDQVTLNALMGNGAVLNGRFYAVGETLSDPIFSNKGRHTMAIKRIQNNGVVLLVDNEEQVRVNL